MLNFRKLKQKIKEFQNSGKENKKIPKEPFKKDDFLKQFSTLEKNMVLQKIKQKESFEKFDDFEELEEESSVIKSARLPISQKMQMQNEIKVKSQNMLSVSPSRNYLLNLETMELDSYECSQGSPLFNGFFKDSYNLKKKID